jgi:hypothetical protein
VTDVCRRAAAQVPRSSSSLGRSSVGGSIDGDRDQRRWGMRSHALCRTTTRSDQGTGEYAARYRPVPRRYQRGKVLNRTRYLFRVGTFAALSMYCTNIPKVPGPGHVAPLGRETSLQMSISWVSKSPHPRSFLPPALARALSAIPASPDLLSLALLCQSVLARCSHPKTKRPFFSARPTLPLRCACPWERCSGGRERCG